MKLYYIICLLFLSACKDYYNPPKKEFVPVLPPYTEIGANTMGCLVNGEIWPNKRVVNIKSCNYYSFNRYPAGYGRLDILVKITNDFSLKIDGFHFKKTGRYTFPKDTAVASVVQYKNNLRKVYDVRDNLYNKLGSGYIELSYLDTINWICSGRFEFDLINLSDKKDTMKIREGRFDFKCL